MNTKDDSESALREECDQLSTILASIPDEVWFTDLEGRFTLFNPAASQRFALEPKQPVTVESLASTLEIFNADGSPRPLEQAPPLRVLRGEEIETVEEIVRFPASGELRYRQIRLARVQDHTGKDVGVVSVARDIMALRPNATEGVSLLSRVATLIDTLNRPAEERHEYHAPEAPHLSARQREVLGLLAQGLTAKEIGQRLFISPETVKSHRRNLMRRLGLRNKAELIRYAIEYN
ncbi:Nitrogen regulation protein C [Thiorhodovibrio winogradskyi]|uniref:Nitrogen regulation protein C n=1 Tax=Thiorhodovibrio winogradskyi TaxID=77007 RepID=A0ABZ0S9I8_9GAMM|nr:LuxR C-terminal-related transcriptional regulator [Thiorhodovibrio winogradskyi]